jgi:hypothetical protein
MCCGRPCTQNLPEHHVERAKLCYLRRMRIVSTVALDALPLVKRYLPVRVEHRVSESQMLREKQKRARELKQSSFKL